MSSMGAIGNAWQLFVAATNDALRTLSIGVDSERFPYWVKRLGMDDALVASFAILDFAKNKLIVAPAEVTLDGDAAAGWTMSIDQNSPVFPCLIA
jgi:hypothetical protein